MGWQDRAYASEDDCGGGGFASRFNSHSVVTWLIIINVVVFVLDAILSSAMRVPSWGSPSYWGEFTVQDGIFRVQVWRFFTYQFFHGDFFHILFNMIGLFFFGPMMERWWGSRRFLAFYLLCGMCGAVIYSLIVLLAPGIIFDVAAMGAYGLAPRTVPIIGASGAVFGILAGCAVLYPKQRVQLIFPPIPMSMRTMALIFLGIAALSLIVGSAGAGGEAAHLGGALLAWALVKHPRVLDWADRMSPAAIQRGAQSGKWQKQMEQRRQEDEEVDRILAKVRSEGLASLTRKEKKTLKQATERQRRDAG